MLFDYPVDALSCYTIAWQPYWACIEQCYCSHCLFRYIIYCKTYRAVSLQMTALEWL